MNSLISNLSYMILASLIILTTLLTGPLLVYIRGVLDLKTHWSKTNLKIVGDAPTPETFKAAVVWVYYARLYNWRGAFASHSWIALKEKNGSSFQIFQVIGWRLYKYQSTIDIHIGPPDRYWYGQKTFLAGELLGVKAERALKKIREASNN